MKETKPLILISNDDGYQAKGINCLIDMVRSFGDVIVCAPDGGRSGQSRAFSLNTLSLTKIKEEPGLSVYSCSGTPVDCIKMAYYQVCPRKPDLIIGGINHGDNASTNAQYSGTVGIIIEGAMKGVPSVAFSLCDIRPDADFEPMRWVVEEIVDRVLREGMPTYSCLNVNYPLVEGKPELRYCRMAHGCWHKEVEKRTHPCGFFDYYWMTGYYQSDEPEAEDTDAWAIAHGCVAVTPLTVDLTDYGYLGKLKVESSC